MNMCLQGKNQIMSVVHVSSRFGLLCLFAQNLIPLLLFGCMEMIVQVLPSLNSSMIFVALEKSV